MKKNSLNRLTSLVLTGLMMTVLGNVSAKEKISMKKMPTTQVAKVDASASSLTWIGKKVTGQHNGSLKIKDGQIMLAKDTLVGGVFNIDMNSITVEDIKDAGTNQNLVGHLKADDFFGTDKNPIATFTLSEAKALAAGQANGATHEIKGTLTIKAITQPLTFQANVAIKDGQVTAEAKEIKIDRTLYNIRYGSGKFFQNLGDKTIDDVFVVGLKLIAKK